MSLLWSLSLKFRIAVLCGTLALVSAWVCAQLAVTAIVAAGPDEGMFPGEDTSVTLWHLFALAGTFAALAGWLAAERMTAPLALLRRRAEHWLSGGELAGQDWSAAGREIRDLAVAMRHGAQCRESRERATGDLAAKLTAVLDNASVGIAFTRNSRFELVGKHLCETLGWEREALIGQMTRVMYASDAERQALVDVARPAFERGGAYEGELTLVRRNGNRFRAHMRGTAVVPGQVDAGTIWIIEDVTRAYDERKRLAWNASHDALTGLANRAAFGAALDEATADAARQPFCALFLDLDRFKQVNDTAGHAAGDALLVELAKLLAAQVRESDLVARLGGDEFAVVLKRCPLANATAIAEKMRAAVAAYRLDWEGRAHGVGVSIGVVHVDGAFADSVAVLKAADSACYAAKHGGRDRVAVHGEA